MKSRVAQCTIILLAGGMLVGGWAQRGGRGIANPDDNSSLPPPASTDIARAKADRDDNIKDATRLAELAEKVKHDLVEGNSYTLSVGTLKDSDEMQRLSKRLYARLKTGNAHPQQTPPGFDASHPGSPSKRQ